LNATGDSAIIIKFFLCHQGRTNQALERRNPLTAWLVTQYLGFHKGGYISPIIDEFMKRPTLKIAWRVSKVQTGKIF
jgi:hypothetical protein